MESALKNHTDTPTKISQTNFFKILLRSVIGGDADVDHTQLIGEDTVKLLGGNISPLSPPWVSAPLQPYYEIKKADFFPS